MSEKFVEMHGDEALDFAENNLRKVRILADYQSWEAEYLDDFTGNVWILDYPDGPYSDIRMPRLRLKDSPGPLVLKSLDLI